MFLRIALLHLVLSTVWAMEDLPDGIEKAIAAYGQAVLKADEQRERDHAKAKEALEGVFQKEYSSLVKKDPDRAEALLKHLADVLEKDPQDLIPKDPAKALVGTWTAVWDRGTNGSNIATESWVFSEDGTCLNGPVGGKWSYGKKGWRITWATGVIDDVPLMTHDDVQITAVRSSAAGKTISMQRR